MSRLFLQPVVPFDAPLAASMPVPRARHESSALELMVRRAAADAVERNDIRGLLALLEIDPLTTARYLRVANSPLFGRRHGVGSAVEALDLLGCRASAMIALVSGFDYGFSCRRNSDRLEQVRAHGLQTAVLARHLAVRTGLAGQGDLLFVAGLLHDIAVMLKPMERTLPEKGFHCARDSAQLLYAWHLPHLIVDAIADLGLSDGRGQPPAAGPGRVLWAAHELAQVTRSEEPSPELVRSMADALVLDAAVVQGAVRGATEECLRIGRCFQ